MFYKQICVFTPKKDSRESQQKITTQTGSLKTNNIKYKSEYENKSKQ